MDRLHGKRGPIEAALSAKEKSLFSLKQSILLYDLTSTYFEGLCLCNRKAKLGYSRDNRPDCKQVVVGLVLDREGFPKAHEIFAGNRSDSTTVGDMLAVLQKRVGKTKDATVVVDRGMAKPENLATIRAAGYHWLVAAPQAERVCYFDQYEEQAGWQEIVREASPRNEGQHKVRVLVKPAQSPDGSQSIALCWSEGRTQKDRAIRQKQEIRFLADIEKLAKRIALGRLRRAAKIYEAIGRLKERYPRVARYYHLTYNEQQSELSWSEDLERKQKAESLDGSYLLKSKAETSMTSSVKVRSTANRSRKIVVDQKRKEAPEKTFHHSVYVILLDPAVLQHSSILRLNPNRDPAKPCVYVGITGLAVQERFQNRKTGQKSAWVLKKYGKGNQMIDFGVAVFMKRDAVLAVDFSFHFCRNLTHLFTVSGYTEILHRNFECVSGRELRIGNDWRWLLAQDDMPQRTGIPRKPCSTPLGSS
jgi:hypothetical protein